MHTCPRFSCECLKKNLVGVKKTLEQSFYSWPRLLQKVSHSNRLRKNTQLSPLQLQVRLVATQQLWHDAVGPAVAPSESKALRQDKSPLLAKPASDFGHTGFRDPPLHHWVLDAGLPLACWPSLAPWTSHLVPNFAPPALAKLKLSLPVSWRSTIPWM